MVLESLTSSIGAILGVNQQLCSSSAACWGLTGPGWHTQIKHEPWCVCSGGSGQALRRVTPALTGPCRRPAVLVVLGGHAGEPAMYHCHVGPREISPLQQKSGQGTSTLLFTANVDCSWDQRVAFATETMCFICIQQNKTTVKWKNTSMAQKEKCSSCPCYRQTAAGLLLGSVSGQCSSGKCFNKSLNSAQHWSEIRFPP